MTSPVRYLAGMGLLVLSICAFAQEIPRNNKDTEDETKKVLEPITVTGYHIKRMDIEGPAPVVVFDRAYIEQTGFKTLEEFAKYLPFNEPFEAGLFSSVGASSFDLRGIGIDNTLVLVNGLRVAPYAQAAENSIDINSIPVAAIDRIEILKDGASAIYGADAIAGVVNIILRSDFEGTEVSAGYGVSEHGDGEETVVDFVTGRSNSRGSFMFSLSWYQRDPQLSRDRDWSDDPDFSLLGGPNERSQYGSPGTLARFDNMKFEHDPACGTDPNVSSIGASPYGYDAGTACRFNWTQFDDFFVSLERQGAGFSGDYEIDSDLSLFGDLRFSSVESRRVLAPAPMSGSIHIGLFSAPFVPAQHPNSSFGTDGGLFYRPLDLNQRVVNSESTSYRGVLGLEGLSGPWNWRLSGMASRNEVDAEFLNFVPEERFQLALLGQGGPGSDQWYNPFGFQPQNDPGLLDWLVADGRSVDESQEYSIDLLFSRELGGLPGGPAGFAVGLQYREQALEQWANELVRSGALSGGAERFPIIADRDISAVFVEFSLPLYEGLEAQLALRFEDYSDFGSTTNPKIALRWQQMPSLMFRGSYSTSFKPPSFFELYRPLTAGLDTWIDHERCRHTDLDLDCSRSPYPFERQGNPDLNAEGGESWFAGLVWVPEFLNEFELQLDFWKFRYEDAIEWYPAWLVLAEERNFGITRVPTEPDGTPGRITLIQETYINADELVTRGLDTILRYKWQTDRAGDFWVSLIHTYIGQEEWLVSLNENLQNQNFAGRFSPRNRASANLAWNRGRHEGSANIYFSSHYRTNDRLWVDGEPTDQLLDMSSHATLDLQYIYNFKHLGNSTLKFGCKNCMDRDPPLHYWVRNEPYHDGRGRYYYMRWHHTIR